MQHSNDPDSIENAELLAHVLPKMSDYEVETTVQNNAIQGVLDNLLTDVVHEAPEEEAYDIAIGVRVSKRTSARIDYFSKRFKMTKAVFLRKLLNERLADISQQMYRGGLLKDVEALLLHHEQDEVIKQADDTIQFIDTAPKRQG